MEIKNLIQATARIVRITELAKGNIVKVIKTEYSTPELFYGIVTDVLQNETSAIVELLLYKKSYGDVKLESIILTGNTDKLEIFPAELEDIHGYFEKIKEEYQSKIDRQKEELAKSEKMFQRVVELLELKTDTLSSPKFEMLS